MTAGLPRREPVGLSCLLRATLSPLATVDEVPSADTSSLGPSVANGEGCPFPLPLPLPWPWPWP